MRVGDTVVDLLVDAVVVFLKLAIPALPSFQPRLRYLRWRRSRLTARISAERSRPLPRGDKLLALQARFTRVSEAFLRAARAREKGLRRHSELYRYATGILCRLVVGRLLSRLHFLLYLRPFRGGANCLAVLPEGWAQEHEFTRFLALGARDPAPGSVGYFVVEHILAIPTRPLVRAVLPPYDSLAATPSLFGLLEGLYLG